MTQEFVWYIVLRDLGSRLSLGDKTELLLKGVIVSFGRNLFIHKSATLMLTHIESREHFSHLFT